MRVDGLLDVPYNNPGILPTHYSTRYNDPSPILMAMSGSYNTLTRHGSVTVTMTAQETLPTDTYKLRIAITETDIYYNTNYTDNHRNVLRDMLPNYQGTTVSLPVGVPVQQTFEFTLPTGVNPPNNPPNHGYIEENVRILAFVQPSLYNPNQGEVQQAIWSWVLDLDATGADPAPARFALEANYPNPFNPVTTLPVKVERAGSALLEILTADGRRVKILHDGALDAGTRDFQWDGRDQEGRRLASGVYIARLTGAAEIHSQRLVLIQ